MQIKRLLDELGVVGSVFRYGNYGMVFLQGSDLIRMRLVFRKVKLITL